MSDGGTPTPVGSVVNGHILREDNKWYPIRGESAARAHMARAPESATNGVWNRLVSLWADSDGWGRFWILASALLGVIASLVFVNARGSNAKDLVNNLSGALLLGVIALVCGFTALRRARPRERAFWTVGRAWTGLAVLLLVSVVIVRMVSDARYEERFDAPSSTAYEFCVSYQSPADCWHLR